MISSLIPNNVVGCIASKALVYKLSAIKITSPQVSINKLKKSKNLPILNALTQLFIQGQ